MAMIHNEHEPRVTARKHAELAATLNARNEAMMPKGRNPEMHQLVADGLRSKLEILQTELDAYAPLNFGDVRT